MSTQEKMQKYIDNTKIRNRVRYSMPLSEAMAMRQIGKDDVFQALTLAFEYGMAKGYRAAKKEDIA